MVNENETNSTPEPKKRSKLFGGRRASAPKGAAQHVNVNPESPAITPEPTGVAPLVAAAERKVEHTVEAVRAKIDEIVERPSSGDSNDSSDSVTSSEPSQPVAEKPRTTRSRAKKPPVEASVETGVDDSPTDQAQTDAVPAAEPEKPATKRPPTTALLFVAPDLPPMLERAPGRSSQGQGLGQGPDIADDQEPAGTVRRRSRRRPGEEARDGDDAPNTVVRVRQPRPEPVLSNEPTRVKGSTRLEAKKQRRRDGRDAGRRRPVITESEFLARRESVDRVMVVREKFDRIQIAVLEDGVLVEHYVAKNQDMSLIGNVYLGRVQNVLPSMEAAFVDIGRGRNAVLYSGEVDWDSVETGNQPRRIELALKPGDKVLVQVTKDPVGHKGARLTSQVSLPGRYLVYVPNGSMSGISRKLPDTERARLKKILKEVLPENTGVIVRTAAEGATEEQLTLDVQRLTQQWAELSHQQEIATAPAVLHSETDLLVKIIRDVFNEDFHKLVIDGQDSKDTIERYLSAVAPDLLERVETFEGGGDPFDDYRVSEQIEKALDRKVWLPSGGSLVIDRTEAMTVVDVNTGKFVGSGGNLEETVTKNNIEAAEEIVRQLRLRDIGGIIVVDFIDMVLESNRDLVLRRLVECLSRDRTKHQVAEVTSLGLVQMTRKKLGLGLLETFSEPCDVCAGRGVVIHHDPATKHRAPQNEPGTGRRSRGGKGSPSNNGGGNNSGGSNNGGGNSGGNPGTAPKAVPAGNGTHAITEDVRTALAQIAAKTVTHTLDTIPDAASVAPDAAPAASAAETAPAAPTKAEEATVAAAEAAVAILDIPVKSTSTRQRKVSTKDAEDILGSVLDALPEPKQPGQGRGRGSRRAGSSGAVVSAPVADGE